MSRNRRDDVVIGHGKLPQWSCSIWPSYALSDRLPEREAKHPSEKVFDSLVGSSFSETKFPPGMIYRSVCHAYQSVCQQKKYRSLTALLSTMIQKASEYDRRSRKLALIGLLDARITASKEGVDPVLLYGELWRDIEKYQYDCDHVFDIIASSSEHGAKVALLNKVTDHFIVALKKEFLISRDLSFIFDDESKKVCLEIQSWIRNRLSRGLVQQCLHDLDLAIANEIPSVQATLDMPSRGADFLWMRSIFGDLAVEIAGQVALCDQLLDLSRQRKHLNAGEAVPTLEILVNGMVFTIEALPSGGGVKPCFKVSALVGHSVAQTLMKLTYRFIPTADTNKAAIVETNLDRAYFASDLLTIDTPSDNDDIESIELQEWMHGIPLRKYDQRSIEAIWELIRQLLEFVVENHCNNITMTDLTLDNIWMTKSGRLVVADKKSLYQLPVSNNNPLVSIAEYPFTATLSYLFTEDEMDHFSVPSEYRPYQICNKSLSTCMLRLVDQCDMPMMSGDFDADMQHELHTKDLVMLLRLRAHIDLLASPHSDRNTAEDVLGQMKSMDESMVVLCVDPADEVGVVQTPGP